MKTTTMQVLVLVKASPVLTRSLEETMCVAGLRVDADEPEWIRLHPVPFRDLADESKFAKYQTVSVEVTRPRADRRPESWSPLHGSITPGAALGTGNGWAERRHLVDQMPSVTMCELVEANRSGSGPGTQSLAIVRPAAPPTFVVSARDEAQLAQWRQRSAAAGARLSLFDDPSTKKPDFEVVPWRFRYHYRCLADGCKGHEQTIVDWEALSLWRNVRHDRDWVEKMRAKFEGTLWRGRDAVLFVGNQEQHPTSFLVLGVFWPPAGGAQGVLSL